MRWYWWSALFVALLWVDDIMAPPDSRGALLTLVLAVFYGPVMIAGSIIESPGGWATFLLGLAVLGLVVHLTEPHRERTGPNDLAYQLGVVTVVALATMFVLANCA